MTRFLLLGCFFVLLPGCMASRYDPPPKAISAHNPHEITITKGYDEAWQNLLGYFSTQDFVLGEIAQDLGMVSVSFKSDQISNYVDCGQYQERDGYSAFSGAYTNYLERYNNPSVTGHMNVEVNSVTDTETHFRISTDYRVMCSSDVWEFNSEQISTIATPRATPGTIPTRSCRATHTPETQLLHYLASL